MQGVAGQTLNFALTEPLAVEVGNQRLLHTFLYGPSCPINLLGQDLLKNLGTQVDMGQQGTVVVFHNGDTHHYSDYQIPHGRQMWLGTSQPGDLLTADVYWGLVLDPAHNALVNSFSSWEPFIRSTWTCVPPPDPMHVTLFYNREGDLAYQEWFNTNLDGQFWVISIPGIVAGPEGIAAPVHLTPEQFQYYKMAPESAPHVTLAVT